MLSLINLYGVDMFSDELAPLWQTDLHTVCCVSQLQICTGEKHKGSEACFLIWAVVQTTKSGGLRTETETVPSVTPNTHHLC